MDTQPAYDRSEFTPLNGRIMLRSMSKEFNVWRIEAIAPNCNLEHYPHLAVGDLVIPWGYTYHGAHGEAISFIKPGDIAAVKKP